MYIFPKRCNGAEELKYIFPSKQKAVSKAIELASGDKRIKRLIVFGSAVTMDCGSTSDVDIAIDVPDITNDDFAKLARPFYIEIPSEVDVIHYNNIQSEMLKGEVEKGVCVYAKHK